MNEELLNEIKGMLPWVLVAALAVGGYYGVKNYRATQRAAASEALVASSTTDDFAEAVSKFGKSDAAGALKLQLAKKYFDDGRYEESASLYDELIAAVPEGYDGIPQVGRAMCLEAQGKLAEAEAAFVAFAEANPESYLFLTAKLGAFRTMALSGRKDDALKGLGELKTSLGDDELAKARVTQLEEFVKRC